MRTGLWPRGCVTLLSAVGLTETLSLCLTTASRAGAAEPSATQANPVVWFKTGTLRGALLTVGQFPMGVADLFPQGPADVLREHGLAGDTTVFPIRSLYLEIGPRRVLIEPGGIDESERLVSGLREEGIGPETIDAVIMTHAHLDHARGATTPAGAASFPKARYFLQKREWDHWLAPDNPEPQHAANFRRILLPIKDRVTLLEGDGEILPGIEALLLPGHSPGHMAILVGTELAYTGDVLLLPLHVSHPEWTARWDLRPAESVESRRAFLERLATRGSLVVATHFPAPGTGRVRREGSGFRWVSESARTDR